MKEFIKKVGLLMIMGIASFNILSIYAYAETTNTQQEVVQIQPRTMYQWNTSVQLYGRQSTAIKGPSGNGYNFTTTNPWPEISYYSRLYIKSSVQSNLEIYATDISTGKVYYANQNGYDFHITGLPKGTFSLTAKDTGTSGALRNIDFYIESRGLVSK